MKVEVRDLSRRFGIVRALENVSFVLEPGRVYGFIGPNGSGKTTALRIMAGMDFPDDGDVFYDGVSVRDYPEKVRGMIGFMPDTLIESAETTVHEYLDFFGRAFALKGVERRETIRKIGALTKLETLESKLLSTLSKGMKQRVSLARILLHNPKVLLLDEPAAGLDPRARAELTEILRQVALSGSTVLISSHVLNELEELCDGVIILERGKLVRTGLLHDLQTAATDAKKGIRVLLTFPLINETLQTRLKSFSFVLSLEVRGPRQLELLCEGDEESILPHLAELFQAKLPIQALSRPDIGLESLFLSSTRNEVQ